MNIIVEGISFSYNSINVLSKISFSIEKGSILSILGPNGSGKTTLLKLICSILPQKEGKIFIDGKDHLRFSPRERAMLFGYVPQRSETVNMSVFEAVLTGRKPYINFRIGKEDIRIVEEVIELVGLSSIKSKSLLHLSGGEFQKVVLARALAQRPNILLFDEPLTYLDIKNQIEIANLIRDITKRLWMTTILVLHDINLAIRYSDVLLFLKGGRVYAIGGREIINEEILKEVFGISFKITEIDGTPYVIARKD